MLPSLALLLACQLAGEVVARLFGLPVPGPVIGMVLLFAGLNAVSRPVRALQHTADGMLAHLSLLFVPAGVGIVQYVGLIADEWLPVGASLVGSTVLTIVVTGLAMRALARPEAAAEVAR